MNLPYRRLFSIMRAIEYNQKEEMERLAFVGWLSGKYEMSFRELLDNLGFTRKYDKKSSVSDILKEAEKIRKEFKYE